VPVPKPMPSMAKVKFQTVFGSSSSLPAQFALKSRRPLLKVTIITVRSPRGYLRSRGGRVRHVVRHVTLHFTTHWIVSPEIAAVLIRSKEQTQRAHTHSLTHRQKKRKRNMKHHRATSPCHAGKEQQRRQLQLPSTPPTTNHT